MLRPIKLLQLGRRFNHNHTPYIHRVEPLREEYLSSKIETLEKMLEDSKVEMRQLKRENRNFYNYVSILVVLAFLGFVHEM